MKCRVATPRIVLAAVFLSTAAAVVSAALVAPTSLTATAESASQIRLTWADSNTNETGFSVERSLSAASGFAVVGSPSKGTTSWVDTGVSPATTYYYRIQATARKGGSSPYSNVASATTPIPVQIPAAPTGAAAVAASTSQINVSWTDNSSNETGFKVERATSSSGPWGQIGTTAGTTYADSGLAASTTYWYRVRAFNTAGDSGYTNSASATTQGTPTVPIAPSNLSAVAASATQINLTWRDNSSDEAGFKIERAPAAAGPWTNIGLAANSATSYSDSGLAASTTYWYRVRAYNVVGDSGYSNAASATTASSGGGTPGSHLWSRNYGGPSASASVFPFSVAVDVTGEIVMTGYFVNSVDMGTGAMTSAGAGDIFVARYGADGTPLWSKRMGSSGDDRGKAIAVDGSGNVYVTGFFRGTVDFGGGGIAAAPSSTNAFLVKYSATGAHLWSKRLSTALGVDEATSLAVDASGNAVVGGVLYQTSDFGGGALTSAGGADIFLVKVSATGAHLWSRRFGGTLDDWVNSVALDGQGNVAATGYFNGSVNLGGASFTSAGGKDAFLAEYSSAGAHLWSRQFAGNADDIARGVAVDAGGNVVVTGNFASASVDFGGGALPNAGGADIFLARYAANGAHVWSKRFGGGLGIAEIASSVATDGAGNVLLTGSVVDTIDFGGGALASDGYYDVFAAKFDPYGAHVWSKRTGAGAGEDIAADAGGNVVVAGDFSGATPVNFGGGVLSSPGGTDTFLVEFAP